MSLGDYYLHHDDMDQNAGAGYHYPMGSIFVKPGCTLYMWNGDNYDGDGKVIQGPAEIFRNEFGHHGVNGEGPPGPRGWQCRCIQDPIQCEPEDGYEVDTTIQTTKHLYHWHYQVILQCDNLDGQTTTKCSYSHTVGTEFSEEVSEGMSVDETVEYAMEASFWEIFKESMGVSISTGYDWGHVTSETRSDQVTITLEAEAPPGLVLVIEQAVGHCGGSEARTEMFRTSHHDKHGNVVFQEAQKMI